MKLYQARILDEKEKELYTDVIIGIEMRKIKFKPVKMPEDFRGY